MTNQSESTVQAPVSPELRTPSKRMLDAAQSAAKRLGKALPETALTSFDECQQFLAGSKTRVDASADALASRFVAAKETKTALGAKTVHFRTTELGEDGPEISQYGGLTVAFRQEGSFLQIATAVCADEDHFNSKIGTCFAVERLQSGEFIRVPLRGDAPEDVVNAMFQDQFDDGASSLSFGLPMGFPFSLAGIDGCPYNLGALFGDIRPSPMGKVMVLVRRREAPEAAGTPAAAGPATGNAADPGADARKALNGRLDAAADARKALKNRLDEILAPLFKSTFCQEGGIKSAEDFLTRLFPLSKRA